MLESPFLELTLAAFTLLGGLTGAWVQNLRVQNNARLTELERLRAESYVGFLQAAANLTALQKSLAAGEAENASGLADAQSRVADARARIAVYGHKSVAKVLANFLRRHGALNSVSAMRSFVSVIDEMRAGLSPLKYDSYEKRLDIEDIGQLVFGDDLNETSR